MTGGRVFRATRRPRGTGPPTGAGWPAARPSARDLLDGVLGGVERIIGRCPLGLDVRQLRGERLLDLRVVETDRRDLHLLGDAAEDLADGRVAEVVARGV